MDRSITTSLVSWKSSIDRKPLIIKGARQIGKSYIIREFGKAHFKNIVEVNLELTKNLKSSFKLLDPEKICTSISLELNQAIIPGETLLFLDEIQECTDALISLRYFYEKMPELHVVCAGSLLDMALDKDKDIRVPVGRIEYLYMFPFSFIEFLEALDEKIALDIILKLTIKDSIPISAHEKLLSLFNKYIMCGGMPAVVRSYKNSSYDLRYKKIQADLIQTYREDFRKYKTRVEIDKLDHLFSRLPNFIAKNFKFIDLCPDYSQATTRNMLNLFIKARIIQPVKTSLANKIPLGAEVRDPLYKILFVDVGLMNSFSDLKNEDIARWNIDLVNSGSIAEQVVGQELLAYSNSIFDPQIYAWTRHIAGSSAEIDYLITYMQKIIPVEVKAGSTGKLKSMRLFMEEKNTQLGIRVSQHELSYHDNILSVPIYAVSRLESLLKEVMREEN